MVSCSSVIPIAETANIADNTALFDDSIDDDDDDDNILIGTNDNDARSGRSGPLLMLTL